MRDALVDFYRAMPFPNNDQTIPAMRLVFSRYRDPPLWLSEDGDLRVLCAGCGTGEELVVMRERFPNASIVGIDPSQESVMIARERGVGEVFVDTIDAHRGEYDLIVCQGVIHHLRDPEKALRDLLSLLAPYGRVWLGVYHEAKRLYPMNASVTREHRRDHYENPREVCYTHEELWGLVSRAGGRVSWYAHPMPRPRSKAWRKLYDQLFTSRRQPMMFVEVQNDAH